MLTKRPKIRKLLESGNAGERAAAAAALDRLDVKPPGPGTPERRQAMIAHKKMVQECALCISDKSLTPAEVTTIRRWSRYIGRPWEDGADELRRIHRKITREDAGQCQMLP